MKQASARAHSNIALIKYWGKRDARLNLPAVGSISITLADLYTDTTVSFDDTLAADQARIGGAEVDPGRLSGFLDIVRETAGTNVPARIVSENNFPTGAGLASSASGFAALALAATRAAGLEMSPRALSILARRGSGSAARSLFGGLVEMHRGQDEDGLDAFAEPILAQNAWPLEVVVAITDNASKKVNSTIGMSDLDARSDFYDGWLAHAEDDLSSMREAIKARDFATVGALSEMSCLKLHGLMLSTRPGLIYWNAATVSAMHAVREMRASGLDVYFTIDAGPQVKALCAPGQGQAVAAELAQVPGVLETRLTALGPDAAVL
ncbi:diphosphomevalonate decarboxylase [Salinisphaera sp. Q1T1-3]|uniref:diphosphomevalonate decarboxylase n=1 Tax=Salinisphaera sp. Q1T1-3 TaxID=2321229 RepID=UPI000E750252|nr:diphosphomevalonate decarboxylase [Salinisphaera sp. Q1T1-3]RJS93952.1 diphosphomevalonate decarboxylase [Salinisphaera sp. Q1T1-3]